MFGLFSSKEKTQERKLRKFSKKLLNMYAQTADRGWAAQQLAEMQTPESIGILLDRFDKRGPNHTIDKDEKNDVERLLVDLGEVAIEPTLAHLKDPETKTVNWPIRVLRHFLETEQLADTLAEVIDAEDLEYGVNPERREELVLTASDLRSEKLGRALVRMLEDANEPVRRNAVAALMRCEYPFAREGVLRRLTDEDESRRITTLILERLVESDWTVKGFKSAIEEQLPEGYAITRAGTVRRRG